MRKKVLSIAAFVIVLALSGCGGADSSKADDMKKESDRKAKAEDVSIENLHHAEISVKDYGIITVALNGDEAPITVENFMKLAGDGFYDGLTFHRIIDGFMIQGGDPLGDGTGGAEETIKGEFRKNKVDNDLPHTRGAISMARTADKDGASSQFFIVHQDSVHLDGDYACFGYVTEGMEVVDEICKNTPVLDGNGTVKKENQPVIDYIKIVD